MSNYTPTIGLEVHAELKTRTKMFCNSKNDPDEKRPNVNVCPICMGHPGTLPVINKEAVRHILKIGTAVGGTLATETRFDRKNYFYPDIPKGYQISQYDQPLVSGGILAGVALTRVHLEEDTARSLHVGEESRIDFNRAGVPLMELVTEPMVHSAEEAVTFAKELQLLLRTLGAGEANMEKGQMRVEANISISKDDTRGTKVEIKNLNSFRSVERAIEFEITRQTKLLERGEKVAQETRGWNEARGETFSQRLKEESHDYRYFPDPDLPTLALSELDDFTPAVLMSSLPELPWDRRTRYVQGIGLKEVDAQTFVSNEDVGMFFEQVITEAAGSKDELLLAANYLSSDVLGLVNASERTLADSKLTPKSFLALMRMLKEGTLSSRGAKLILPILLADGGDPREHAQRQNLEQKSNTEHILSIVKQVLKNHSKVAETYRAGKTGALQFLLGQVMKESSGSANPKIAKEILEKELGVKR